MGVIVTQPMKSQSKTMLPLEYLKHHNGKNVFVKLKDGSEYMGKLMIADPSMNVVLTDAKEVTETNKILAIFGNVFIRGSNLLFISIEPEKVRFLEPEQPKPEEQQEQKKEED
ncbi:MAG: LSM domain-containing protein [Infirmifilum sp.]